VFNIGKKQVKIVSLTVAVLFMLGVVGIAVSQSGQTSVASAASQTSNIGVVNHQLLISQHPDTQKAQDTMNAEVEQAKKDFEAKTATMNDQEKQDYYKQIQERLTLKNKELMDPIIAKVDEAIKKVATAKSLTVIMDKSNVVYGGQDITDDVGKKLIAK